MTAIRSTAARALRRLAKRLDPAKPVTYQFGEVFKSFVSGMSELNYEDGDDSRPNLKNGKPLTYKEATRTSHRNHVHSVVVDPDEGQHV